MSDNTQIIKFPEPFSGHKSTLSAKVKESIIRNYIEQQNRKDMINDETGYQQKFNIITKYNKVDDSYIICEDKNAKNDIYNCMNE